MQTSLTEEIFNLITNYAINIIRQITIYYYYLLLYTINIYISFLEIITLISYGNNHDFSRYFWVYHRLSFSNTFPMLFPYNAYNCFISKNTHIITILLYFLVFRFILIKKRSLQHVHFYKSYKQSDWIEYTSPSVL